MGKSKQLKLARQDQRRIARQYYELGALSMVETMRRLLVAFAEMEQDDRVQEELGTSIEDRLGILKRLYRVRIDEWKELLTGHVTEVIPALPEAFLASLGSSQSKPLAVPSPRSTRTALPSPSSRPTYPAISGPSQPTEEPD